MKIELSTHKEDKNKISSYSESSFTINEQVYSTSIIISASELIAPWSANIFNDLALQHIEQLISFQPEIIIIGTGKQVNFLPEQLTSVALEKGIGMELMDSGAACRSYNLLLEEGRQVVAGLLLPGAG